MSILVEKGETFVSLNIKHPKADKLARSLAHQTGETVTEAVIKALEERLLKTQERYAAIKLKETLLKIGHRCAALPDRDQDVASSWLQK